MSKKRVKFPEIRESLRKRQEESQAIRARIHAAHDMERWHLWNEKRSFGDDTRHELLAYGMLRGLPYLACEKRCGETNHPYASAIANVTARFGHEKTPDEVRAWLDAPLASAAEVAA